MVEKKNSLNLLKVINSFLMFMGSIYLCISDDLVLMSF